MEQAAWRWRARLLLRRLSALVDNAHDLHAGSGATGDKPIHDRVMGAGDDQHAITRPIGHLPAEVGMHLEMIDGALNSSDGRVGVCETGVCQRGV